MLRWSRAAKRTEGRRAVPGDLLGEGDLRITVACERARAHEVPDALVPAMQPSAGRAGALPLLVADRHADVRLAGGAWTHSRHWWREQRQDVVARLPTWITLADRLDDARPSCRARSGVARGDPARRGGGSRVAGGRGGHAGEHLPGGAEGHRPERRGLAELPRARRRGSAWATPVRSAYPLHAAGRRLRRIHHDEVRRLRVERGMERPVQSPGSASMSRPARHRR